ncbi:MAG: hypothetical protein ABW025_00340 [Cellulomonas sp.]
MTQRFPFEGHGAAPLIVDAVYEGGTANNQGDDPINKLLSVGNAGGFRPLGSIVKRTVKYVVLYTSGVDPDWPDVLDPRTGGFVYHGDQKEPGRELHDTPRRGNLLLRHLFELAEGGPEQRAAVPPIFLFEKAAPGRSVAFRGLHAPGGPAFRPDERLAAVWKSRDGKRFQNYRATFTVLDEASVSRAWLDALRSSEDADAHAPAAWREWSTNTGTPRRLDIAWATGASSQPRRIPGTETVPVAASTGVGRPMPMPRSSSRPEPARSRISTIRRAARSRLVSARCSWGRGRGPARAKSRPPS